MKSDHMQVLQMDVCSDQEVAQAVDFVKRTLKEPEEGVWGSLYFQHSWLCAVLTESFLQTRPCTGWVIPSLHGQRSTSLVVCDSVWLAVGQCCTRVSEENCLAVDVASTWEETKTG